MLHGKFKQDALLGVAAQIHYMFKTAQIYLELQLCVELNVISRCK